MRTNIILYILLILHHGSTTKNGVETTTGTSAIKINYQFSWGIKNENLKNKNIVTGWKPEVDLYSYLMRRANHQRYLKIKELYEKDPDTYKEKYDMLATSFSNDVVEMYNAELELIGIPADPPMAAEVVIIPRILGSFSRTMGVYSITSSSDEISNTGVFRTTLKLVRQRSIDAVVETTQQSTNDKAKEDRLKYLESLDRNNNTSTSKYTKEERIKYLESLEQK